MAGLGRRGSGAWHGEGNVAKVIGKLGSTKRPQLARQRLCGPTEELANGNVASVGQRRDGPSLPGPAATLLNAGQTCSGRPYVSH